MLNFTKKQAATDHFSPYCVRLNEKVKKILIGRSECELRFLQESGGV